jgi:Protein of unknown function (DUF499)
VEPWYKVALPRAEVREGRSFNPNEFAIALEQVVAGRGPEDYRDPEKFFARTYFTRALREHAGMVLRRLAGHTANAAPDLTLITQFGGGKTHTLTALYHLVKHGPKLAGIEGVPALLRDAGLAEVPRAAVGVFVGNAWDPQDGRETPWLDLAWQLAGAKGAEVLGPAARTTAPGTDALARLFEAAGGRVLVLCDEVLNFVNRHRSLADGFYAFLQNLTVAMTGTTHCVAVLSLPRSPVEMTEFDREWQDRISKVVRRVAKDLIATDETEVSEVIRRRLFETVGRESVIRVVAKHHADWCFERRAQLPPEWTAVDTAVTEAKAKDFLRMRFEACFPFHPATLSVFQRKWQGLAQYQQTRGTLAMFAQWISWAYRDGYRLARRESLITLGSAPLEVPEFRGIVLGQLGEPRLAGAIDTDLAADYSHAHALDADTKGALRGLHRRVGLAILFESSGGMVEKVAHLPELRFAIGEPEVETTSVDNAANALEGRAYYLRKVGTDGYRFGFQPTLKKVVSDRRASLNEHEVARAVQALVKKEFERAASLPVLFAADGSEIPDATRLTLVVLDPARGWDPQGETQDRLRTWVRQRGESLRLTPGALVWCAKTPSRDLRERVELWLAWQRVHMDLAEGLLGSEFDQHERADVVTKVREAETEARGEVWAEYRFVILADPAAPGGLQVLDLGPGHPHGSETLCGRIITALKSQNLLNESVGAGYIERKWPPAFKDSGAWPLSGLRQAFLNGSLTRLLDTDVVLKTKIVEFVQKGDFGLASGEQPGGAFTRLWFKEPEPISADEVVFDGQTYLLLPSVATKLKAAEQPPAAKVPTKEAAGGGAAVDVDVGLEPKPTREAAPRVGSRRIRLSGSIPPEIWNRVGTRLLPKFRGGTRLNVSVGFEVEVDAVAADQLLSDIQQILADLSLADRVRTDMDP